jgi:hypothetical protein
MLLLRTDSDTHSQFALALDIQDRGRSELPSNPELIPERFPYLESVEEQL